MSGLSWPIPVGLFAAIMAVASLAQDDQAGVSPTMTPAPQSTVSVPAATPLAAPTGVLAASPSIDDALQSDLVGLLDQHQGHYGVAALDLTSGRSVAINADDQFEPASTYKVLIMYAVEKAYSKGTLNPNTPLKIAEEDAVEGIESDRPPGHEGTVADTMEAMIRVSSNTAARALVRTLGGWRQYAIAAAELGMKSTGFPRDGLMVTTPADMVTFLSLLAQNRLVSAEASQSMIALMASQTIRDRIPAGLPPGTIVANKTGNYTGMRHDVAIVYAPGSTYVLAAYSQTENEQEATSVIVEISRIVYQHFAS